MNLGSSKIPIDILLGLCNLYKITPNDILEFQNEFPATEISKIHKLYQYINSEKINIDELLNVLKLSKKLFS